MIKKMLLLGAVALSLSSPIFSHSSRDKTHYTSHSARDAHTHDWSFEIDYLYWTARKGNLDYALTAMTTPVTRDKIYSVDPQHDSGFRIGGKQQNEMWDFGFTYTFYCSDAKDSITDPNLDLASTRTNPDDQATISNSTAYINGQYEVDLNVIDLEIGRQIPTNMNIDFRIFGGIKLAFIDEEFNSTALHNLGDVGKNSRDSFLDRHDLLTYKNAMNAYGLSIGSEFIKHFGNHFDLMGNLSTALLVADIDRSFTQINGLSGTPTLDDKYTNESYRMIGNLNLLLGLKYNFNKSWKMAIGYEAHLWFNTADFLQVLDNSATRNMARPDRHGDTLGFDGLFVKLGVTF